MSWDTKGFKVGLEHEGVPGPWKYIGVKGFLGYPRCSGHRGTVSGARGNIWGRAEVTEEVRGGIWGHTEESSVHGSVWGTQRRLRCLRSL